MNTESHFNRISDTYDQEIPEHVRLHLLSKKTGRMLQRLASRGTVAGRGLDCGCGTGHYLARMARHGYEMSGIEYSDGMLAQARNNTADLGADLRLGSITDLPFPDADFDFCYTLNVLHHLPGRDEQIEAIREMLRVTKPGGLVFVQDFDADNPLVRVYMNVIFPLTSRIDDDETEIWVSCHDFRRVDWEGAVVVDVERFTLLPNFTPRAGFPVATALERGAERLFRNRFGAHFNFVLERLR